MLRFILGELLYMLELVLGKLLCVLELGQRGDSRMEVGTLISWRACWSPQEKQKTKDVSDAKHSMQYKFKKCILSTNRLYWEH